MCSCPTEHISEFLDSIFQPLVADLLSFLKNTNHAITTFESIILTPGSQHHIFTLGVISLYTAISHNDGLSVLHFFLERYPDPVVHTDTLICLAALVLTHNSFEFNGLCFDQISGVATGTKMGPSYTSLFMGHFEHQVWQQYAGSPSTIPQIYR